MRKRNNQKKEKALMLASSLLVLSALTLTGVYVKEKSKSNEENIIVDFASLEDKTITKAQEIGNELEESVNVTGNHVENTFDNSADLIKEDVGHMEFYQEELELADGLLDDIETNPDVATTEVISNNTVSFEEGESIFWPIVGNILINYSMDKTVYFKTLQQYKYNPGIVIEATVGANIMSATDGIIVSVEKDDKLGNIVRMDIGNGYEITYGQLENITAAVGDYLKQGEIFATVSNPTKYYSVEGANVYFSVTKDGEAINPLSKLS
ncbi:MAG: peptidoglycan DD-metalloendopeptidase family protein [Lachnospiraceae bacterium]